MPAVPLITPDAIRSHLAAATSRSALLSAIGVAPAAQNYARLERVAGEHGITLPPKAHNGKSGARPELRTSTVWDEEKLRAAIARARTFKEIAGRLGLDRNAVPRIHRAAAEFGLALPRSHGGPDPVKARAAAVKRVFKKGTRRINGERLKRYILDLGVIPYLCGLCGQPPEWNGMPLVLQIDHVMVTAPTTAWRTCGSCARIATPRLRRSLAATAAAQWGMV